MSRTYKDKPSKLKGYAWDKDREYYNYTRVWVNYSGELVEHEWKASMETKTTRPKKRKEVDTEDHYLSGSPSWWNNLFHTRPIRNKFKAYCKNMQKYSITELANFLEPLDSNKPHKYYY